MAHTNPNTITGKIVIGDIAKATGNLTIEGSSDIEKAEILSNTQDSNILNGTMILKVKLCELEDEMLCFTQIVDTVATGNSGATNVVIKEVIDITTFVIQIQYKDVIDNNIILNMLFVKNSLS